MKMAKNRMQEESQLTEQQATSPASVPTGLHRIVEAVEERLEGWMELGSDEGIDEISESSFFANWEPGPQMKWIIAAVGNLTIIVGVLVALCGGLKMLPYVFTHPGRTSTAG
jgi:hypothetical protein